MSADQRATSTPLAEISNAPSGFESFLDRNQKGVIGLAVVLALSAVGVVIYRGVEQGRQHSGGVALSGATDTAALSKVVSEHPNTYAAGSAMILLADSQWAENKKDEAIATLQKFASEFPEHAAIPAAEASLATKLLAQGKTGDAAKIFETLSKKPEASYLAPFALISLGDIAKAESDIAKAEEYYKEVQSNFPASPFNQTAADRIQILKAKPPVEIEAPAAPDESAVPQMPFTPGAQIPQLVDPVSPDAPPVETPATPEPQDAPE